MSSAQSNNSTTVRINKSTRRVFKLLSRTSRLAPGLASLPAVSLFCTPRRFRRPDREAELLKKGEVLALPSGIAAWSWGEGPVVLLVHGWEGAGAQLGEFVEPLVQSGYRVVAFDAPAHGASKGNTATVRDFVSAICACERAVDGIHAVIAHSFGALAVSLALSEGLQCAGACFLGAPADVDIASEGFAAITGLSEPARERMVRRVERRASVSVNELRVERFGPRMRTPLYVVHDCSDADVPILHAKKYAAHWPDATLRETHSLGHRKILRDAEVVSDVTEFVASLGNPARRSELLDGLGAQSIPRELAFTF